MALDRTNMVSLLDIGLLMENAEKIAEMGDGYTELSEDWGPNTQSTQYINQKNASNTVKGYGLSMSPSRECLSDEMQECINYMLKNLPTGEKCESYYYRYFKTDIKNNTGDCIRVPVTVCPSSVGGAGGDVLTSSIQINGNGDVEQGTITIGAGGTFTWKKKEDASAGSKE